MGYARRVALDLHDFGCFVDAVAVADAKVQRRADDNDQVRARKCRPARVGERELVVVGEGTVRLQFSVTDDTAIEIGPGDYFGELSIANGNRPRGIGAQAVDNVAYLVLGPDEFKTLRDTSPDVATKVAQVVLEAISEKVECSDGCA